MSVIYFDLDGPLLDVAEKYYRTYSDIVSASGYVPIDKFLYWELKRNRTPEKEILELSGAGRITNIYKAKRKSCIETDLYIEMDTLQPCVDVVLKSLSEKGFRINLVTLRTSSEQLHKQLKSLGIFHFFENILSSGAETTPRWKIKYDLITEKGNGHPFKEAIFVGDTETDIIAANELGLCSVGVLNGIRNFQLIKDAQPQFILTGVHELPKLIH